MYKEMLLVIDVQNYFVRKNSKSYICNSEKMVKKMNNIIKIFHDNNRLIVFLKFVPSKNKNNFKKWWKHLPEDKDLELYPYLHFPEKSYVFLKNSYSIFKKKIFRNFLRNRRIKRIYFMGFMTELCVESNVRDSFEYGFENFIFKDLVGSRKIKLHSNALKTMARGFGKLIDSRDFINGKV